MKNEYLILWRQPVFYQSKVKAESEEEALKLFYKLKEDAEFINDTTDFGDIEIDTIAMIEPELSDSDLAFMAAYQSAVGNAPKEIVKLWLQHKDHDKFYDDYSEYYASITDAYEIWLMAQSFIKENSK